MLINLRCYQSQIRHLSVPFEINSEIVFSLNISSDGFTPNGCELYEIFTNLAVAPTFIFMRDLQFANITSPYHFRTLT
jgi:hypothetical protein